MPTDNKAILLAANAAVTGGDNEGFLKHCADEIQWETVGEKVVDGKEAVREWMRKAYAEPPRFTVTDLVAEGDLVVALGSIWAKDEDGNEVPHLYSDVWRFRDGSIIALKAFVIRSA